MKKAEEEKKIGRLEEIKREIAGLGEMRVGSLSMQYNVCGTPGCRCKDRENPRRHGPYHQLSFTRNGKSGSEFVRKADVEPMKERLENYRRFMELKDEWIDICIELAKLRKGAKQ